MRSVLRQTPGAIMLGDEGCKMRTKLGENRVHFDE